MKERRPSLWRWCPQPERLKLTRTRPTERAWLPLIATALILSLLAFQGIQMWTPSAVNTSYPNNYAAFPTVEPRLETPAETVPAAESTTSVSSDHLTVQFTFPESADPGNTVTISATTTAKANKRVNSLSIEVFTYVDRQLAKVATATVLKEQKIRSGDTWQTTLAVTIPLNAERSTMIGTVTEVWEETSSYYSSSYYLPYYPYYGPYPYSSSYPYYPSYPYDRTIFYAYQPSYVVTEKSSQQTLPLTYVLATTPEYDELLAKHEQLQQEYDALVARHNELSSKYDSLRADYDQAVSKYNQLESNYNTAVLELANYKTLTYILIVVAAALGAALALLLVQRGQVTQPPKKSKD